MKKTLVIDPRVGGDFSMDLVWAGLVNRFGWQNVVDFPTQEKHRRKKPVLTGDPERDYGAERSSLGFTPDNHKIPQSSQSEINNMILRGEIERIFIDEREESYHTYLQTVARFYKIPVVVIAGHDRFWNKNPDWVRTQYYNHQLEKMFIDDWQPEYDLLPYCRLTNLSINFEHLWNYQDLYDLRKKKVYDICFMGYNSIGNRAWALEHIQKNWGHLNNHIMLEKRGDTFDRFVRHDEYFMKMAQSKICINVPGASVGGRALRYYEIPYVGSFMLSQRFPARLLYPFEEGKHCAYFSTLEELDQKLELYLSDDELRERIAQKGWEHATWNHHVNARINYIYGELGN